MIRRREITRHLWPTKMLLIRDLLCPDFVCGSFKDEHLDHKIHESLTTEVHLEKKYKLDRTINIWKKKTKWRLK